jgi:ABC-2 type transport system ATP-binding protein
VSAVSTTSLCKSFGNLEAVRDVTLEVGDGEVFGLIGPNGAGKTTLIRLLCGLYTPSAGQGSVLGLDIAREQARIRERVGYMSQSNGLYADLSVDENIRLYAELYGVRDPAWTAQVRRWLSLQDVGRRVVATLPTGVRQRAALAAALAHRPRLMVLDEPTSGVDLVAREAMWDLLGEIARGGVTVLVTTHVMAEARRCDRLALIAEGRLVATGAPEELIRRSDVVIAVVDASPWSEAFARVQSLWPTATLFGTRTHIPVARGEEVEPRVRRVLSGLEVRSVTWREPSMEDAFIALVAAARQ